MLEDVTQDVKTPLVVLLCAVGCMLLIACLNVSNLLVARSASRRKELAVRGALGGSRLMLIGEQMAESLLICAAGGTLGVLLSFAATRLAWRPLERSAPRGRYSSGYNRSGVCCRPGFSYCLARRSSTRCLLNWRGHLRRAAGIFPVDRRQRVPCCVAQNLAHRRDCPHGDSAGLRRLAVQELFASAHV